MSHHLDSPIARPGHPSRYHGSLCIPRRDRDRIRHQCLPLDLRPDSGVRLPSRRDVEFKIDLDGDAVEDVTYRFTFGGRDQQGQAELRRTLHRGRDAVDPHAPGSIVARADRRDGRRHRPACAPGQAKLAIPSGSSPMCFMRWAMHSRMARVNLNGWDPSQAKNLFAGHTVYSIVLEVPNDELLASAPSMRRIGVWAVATLATDACGWRSINRVGLPMIPPLFTQYNEDLGNRLNAGRPADDFCKVWRKPSPRRSPASSRRMEPRKTRTVMRKRSLPFLS